MAVICIGHVFPLETNAQQQPNNNNNNKIQTAS